MTAGGASALPEERRKYKILLVEDDPQIIRVLRLELEHEGYDVDTAADGQEATDLVSGGPDGKHDLFLFDAMMPRKSGIDALRELRSAGVDTPALIVSAHQDPSDADAAPSDLEISGYVTKPIDFERLLGSIAELTRD